MLHPETTRPRSSSSRIVADTVSSHADLLHVDFSINGEELLVDPGTFAYTAAAPWGNGLAGTRVHNTASIDDEDQLRQLGRFMWTHWSDAQVVWHARIEGHSVILARCHADHAQTVTHERLVVHGARRLVVLDELAGTDAHTLRIHWNLAGADWYRRGEAWTSGRGSIRVYAPPDASHSSHWGEASSVLGWCSQTYGSKEPCLAIEAATRATRAHFMTVVWWGEHELPLPESILEDFEHGERRTVAEDLVKDL